MRVLIVDDHVLIRRGLRDVLEETAPHVRVTEAATGQAALEHARQTPYSMIVLDLDLPDMNGLDVLAALTRLRPSPPVLILSLHEEAQYAERALQAGASGYLMKDRATDELVAAFRKISTGGTYVSDSLADHLAGLLRGRPATALDRLSNRELEVLKLLAGGRTVKQIAARLSVTDKTVSTYRARLLDKLRLRTTADLIRYALEHKLA